MVINTVMSHQFKFKFIPGFRTFLFPEKKDIHYIGGSEVLPAPLAVEEEAEAINELGSKDDEYAKKVLIEQQSETCRLHCKKILTIQGLE